MGKTRESRVMPTDPLSNAGLLCQACGFLLLDPQQAECGHRYCRRCVQALFRNKERVACHTCKTRLSSRQFHSDKAAEKDALATDVACPNFDCSWTGTLKSYQEHACPPLVHHGTVVKAAFDLGHQDIEEEAQSSWSIGSPIMGDPALNVECVQMRVEALELMVLSLRRQLASQGAMVKSLQHNCSQYEKLLRLSQEKNKESKPPMPELVSTDGTLVWKVENFSKLMKESKAGGKRSIYSPVFATHTFGYHLCVRLYPDGDGIGQGGHLSLFLALAKGPYDDILPWPFRQKVTFCLLDPTRKKSPIMETFLPDPHSSSFHQPRERLNVASGSPLFASHVEIPNYLKDDTLYLKVVVDLAGMEI
ncbi:TNF receptor-associated factor 2 [Anolis carolinensis]|uniref:TNF receptor-associated factor 2 n=1 Tax=Anolis carolinensis TaxID=28377 RepID=UPI002F2B1956